MKNAFTTAIFRRCSAGPKIIGVLLLSLTGHSNALGQASTAFQARVESPQMCWTDPASITEVKYDNAQVASGRMFAADPDLWPTRLHVQVRNNSQRSIVSVTVSVSYPETGSGSATEPVVANHVRFGNRPDYPADAGDNAKPNLFLAPGDSTEFAIGNDYLQTKPLLLESSKLGKTPPTDWELQILDVTFDDGTHYWGGAYQRKDPANPGHYTRVSSAPYISR